MEKAQKLKSALTKEILSGTTSTNILAMTFRQVLLQNLWNFELVLFIPGAERNMDDLETPREVGNFLFLDVTYAYSLPVCVSIFLNCLSIHYALL